MSYSSYADVLAEFTVQELKELLNIHRKNCPEHFSAKGTTKDGLINSLKTFASSQEIIKNFYKNLPELEQNTLQEVVHKSNGQLHADQIAAKYGSCPYLRLGSSYWGEKKEPSPLTPLFSKEHTLSKDLLLHLKDIVPVPKKTLMDGLDALPKEVSVRKYSSVERLSLIAHETEAAALSDLTTLLRLCEAGIIGVGESTGIVSIAGANKIREMLVAGDFYSPQEEAPNKYDAQMGALGIRTFAWPLILQAGKIAKIEKGKLTLGRTAKRFLSMPKHEVIHHLFTEWLGNEDFHEFSRIDIVKGQKSKKRPLNKPVVARNSISDALTELPVGKWVNVDDFFRFLIASGHRFEIARDAWALYICEPEYGSLGYNSIEWRHINGRFALAFLLEYAATLGIIDVGLTKPWNSVADYGNLWGTDDLSCLSRYDGLKYIRLTALGDWILNSTEKYETESKPKVSQFQILPNLELTLLSEEVLPSDKILVERLCDQTSDRVWCLSKSKILGLLEQGVLINEVKAQIAGFTPQAELPDHVLGFLTDLGKKASQIVFKGTVSLIECQDAATAVLIANDRDLKKFTTLVNERHLMISKGYEDSFRKAVKKLGFVLPT